MTALRPNADGFVEHRGTKINFHVYGESGPTILLLPTWTLVHQRIWKMQVPHLSRHFRVVTYDGPGNGGSDRPLESSWYSQESQIAYALAVLDATGTDKAVVVALSRAANWALELAAEHPSRVHGTVIIGPAISLPPQAARSTNLDMAAHLPQLPPTAVPRLGADPQTHWAKYNWQYWLEHYEDFAWFFLGQCFPEPHSTKPIDDGVAWALETTGAVLVAESRAGRPDEATIRDWCARIGSPLLAVHGTEDRISPLARSELLCELTGGELVTIEGAGHVPQVCDPVRLNLLIGDFAARFRAAGPRRSVWPRWSSRPKRVLYLSSPIGLGHARRDLAITRQLRERHPGVRVDWLTQHPVTRMLADEGERVHPASRLLLSESAHIEDESGEHDLHAFQALRSMDEILMNNFMVFHDLVTEEQYDLVVGDEAWDVDHFLHENPELKRFAYAWLTDFVGFLPMPGDDERAQLVTADYNAEMIERIARFPRLRDRAVFVGDPDDIVPSRFGDDMPFIRDWTESHFSFAGYVTGFDPITSAVRESLRAELGYRPGEPVCVVTVGGSGVGGDLLRRVAAAYPEAARRVPGLRMIIVTGPRIDPSAVPARPGLEVHGYLPGLHRHLAAADLAVVQGGLTTCMELTASNRPFIYVPLRRHFEQNLHVGHRLRRHDAGRRMDYETLDPDTLAEAIAEEIGREVSYRPVTADGADRAAALLAGLL
ncbi:alpha/beta fold hydrolase [Actinoplanes sp. NPDC051513]|uniref:alpha/beta hydrolase n=1 Tax=Actinoplanes sp. NPDC051513 TaxID=3363908 RepID=UPI0037BCF64A